MSTDGQVIGQPELPLAGICGIYCGTCPSYLAPRSGDVEQVHAVSERHGIDPVQVVCDGCLSAHVMEPCRVCRHGFRTCAADHHVTWCFECTEFPCERLLGFRDVHVKNGISHHEHVVENLTYMKLHGVGPWLDVQAERARCDVCGTANYWFSRTCAVCCAPLV